MRAEEGSVSQSLTSEGRSVWEVGPNPKNTQSTGQFILVKSGGRLVVCITPWKSNGPFIGATCQIFCLLDTQHMSHNSGKIAVMSWQQDNFITGGHNTRNCMKGPQPE